MFYAVNGTSLMFFNEVSIQARFQCIESKQSKEPFINDSGSDHGMEFHSSTTSIDLSSFSTD